MSISEFRWNKKRKHYAYIHKKDGLKRICILISSKPYVFRKGKITIRNVLLYRHPNCQRKGLFYLIPRNYADDFTSFDLKVYKTWRFDNNDKRKVKRIKNNKY